MATSGVGTGASCPVPTGPIRTCIGCRRTGSRSDLMRVVADEVEGRWYVVPDPAASRHGRGAWLHLDLGCLQAAVRRKAFGRALRQEGGLDLSPTVAWVEQHTPGPQGAGVEAR